MGTIGTFGSFTQARLAIYASQMGLSVTGNNISNINTTGYTRQKLDQESLRTGGADRYHSSSIRVGNGVLASGVSQLRDPYLDIRYRSEMSSVGAMDAKLGGLESIQAILDEVGDGKEGFGIIESQLSDLYNALQQINDQTGHAEYDIQVRSSAESLAKQLNSYAAKLQEVYNNTEKAFHQDVETVNGILTNIRDLNAAIRKNEIHGDNALELKDQRNMLIDQLSEYMKIDVLYGQEDIGAGQMVEKLTIRLANANPDQEIHTDESTLIDGIFATQLKADGANYDITLSALTSSNGAVLKGSTAQVLNDNDIYGALQSERELLTEQGEFSSQTTITDVDKNAASKRGIPYYQKSLDLLASQLAKAFNDANQGCVFNEKGEYITGTRNETTGVITGAASLVLTYPTADGQVDLTLTKDMTFNTLPEEAQNAIRTEMGAAADAKISLEDYVAFKGGIKLGKPLFSNHGDSDDTTNITAANISISDSWSAGPQIVRSFKLPTGLTSIPSTDGDNIVSNMVTLFTEKRDFIPNDISPDSTEKPMFNGSFQEMWSNIGAVLGNDIKVTTTLLDTYHASSVDLDTSRMGMSSVDLNDEAMNLMQYSQSYNAACRLMTTLDSILDKLINGTGMTL